MRRKESKNNSSKVNTPNNIVLDTYENEINEEVVEDNEEVNNEEIINQEEDIKQEVDEQQDIKTNATNFKPFICSCIVNKSLFKREKVNKLYMTENEKSATDMFMNDLIKEYTIKGKLKIKGLEIKEVEMTTKQ